MPPAVLPMTRAEMDAAGWDRPDILLVSGDAYIDHPSFGTALVGRWLMAEGFRVALIAQPDWRNPASVAALGRPRLFAGVSAGALDSMLAHYTAFRKKRHDDAYTPGGKAGGRPNRACIVYTSLLRGAFPDLPVILGGIEASLRRITHYDFWTDALRRPILFDSKADAVLYGMAETTAAALAKALDAALPPGTDATRADLQALLPTLPGTAFVGDGSTPPPGDASDGRLFELPSHEEILARPAALIEATRMLERQMHAPGHTARQAVGKRILFLTPPPVTSSTTLDAVHALPFTRMPHPSYTEEIPAWRMIRFSITAHRGCAGGCAFCSLALHQGRRICSRSEASLLGEAEALTHHPAWDGSITDVGGPSANMWGGVCARAGDVCTRVSCLTPEMCPHFSVDDDALARMLRHMRGVEGVGHVRIASGIRHDLASGQPQTMRELLRHHVGGQLKLAPEHMVESVTRAMRKPSPACFEAFLETFARESDAAGKRQYVIPYLMSAFPGCTEADMERLAGWLRARGWEPQQVQCFIPTPGTMATAMYYAGLDEAGQPIPVARSDAERLRQHAILTDWGTPSGGRRAATREGGQRRHGSHPPKGSRAHGGAANPHPSKPRRRKR